MVKSKKYGFSMVELMVVMSIISIFLSFALPAYKKFAAKAKQTEVKTMMRQIIIGQQSYYAEHASFIYLYSFGGEWGTCADPTKFSMAAQLGISMKQQDCNLLRYTYFTNESSPSKYHAVAYTRNLFPTCSHSDSWSVNTDTPLYAMSNAVTLCRMK